MAQLTKREYAVFSCARQFIADQDRSPTRREIADLLSIAPQTVDGHLRRLAAKKFVALIPRVPRNIKLLRQDYRRQPKLL